MAGFTQHGLEAMREQVKRREKVMRLSAQILTQKRGEEELEEQKDRMPRMKKNAPATIRQKGSATPFIRTGTLIERGYVKVRRRGRNAFAYVIRWRGSTGQRQKSQAKKRARDGSSVTSRALKRGGFSRRIKYDKLVGILKSGVDGRIPARPFHVLPGALQRRLSLRLVNREMRIHQRRMSRADSALVSVQIAVSLTMRVARQWARIA